jgi:DNA invertase Pin-like site-specific DNA recombinase
MTTAPAYDNSVRIGYARVSTRAQEHQAQLDALAAAHCREIITETASTRGDRPRLREALGQLQAGDTLVIYKPDRVARSMKELLVLLEDQLHARGINLHILTGICAGMHRPDGATIADKMLFMVAAMAAEMERDLIRERTLDGLRAAEAQGRRGGRPAVVDDDVLAVARARQSRGESVTAIARHLKIGRSTLYRALQPDETDLALAAVEPARGPRDDAGFVPLGSTGELAMITDTSGRSAPAHLVAAAKRYIQASGSEIPPFELAPAGAQDDQLRSQLLGY